MTADINQLASILGVQSVLLIGISLFLLVAAWKGFERSYLGLPSPVRDASKRASIVAFCLICALIAATTVTGIFATVFTAVAYFLVILVIAALAILLLLIVVVLRTFKKFKRPEKPDTICSLYHFSLLLNIAGIFCSTLALLAMTISVINVNIDPFHFKWGKWLLLDGVVCFVFVLFTTGLACFLDRTSQMKTNKPLEH